MSLMVFLLQQLGTKNVFNAKQLASLQIKLCTYNADYKTVICE